MPGFFRARSRLGPGRPPHRGEVKGDHLVVNGQKVWTSYARYADWLHPDRAHRSRRTEAPRPDVRPPRHADAGHHRPASGGDDRRRLVQRGVLRGRRDPAPPGGRRINRGWEIATATLSHERGTVVPYPRLRHHLDGVAALARRLSSDAALTADPLVRQRLAQLAIDVQLLRLSVYRNITQVMRSGKPGPEGSMLRLLCSEIEQRIMETASAISGAYAQLDEHAPQAFDAGRWQY
ncbi:MAG TPA: acyl-CoA dehydrogenase family protein, partial [Candidatus Dormibacteraeota bacterium]|nr:acyl-CoA dehydrogenase family protein [Candidatus Dormibacteraeota bacterium]